MRHALWIVALMGLSGAAGALEVKPVVDAKLLGGQNYYNAAEGDLGAVASLSVAPYMKFNDKWSLVPLYAGHYQGTVQITDLTGGGTPFRDSQDHTLSTKLIRSFDHDIKVKAVGGYGLELLRETKDEDWTKGLYDNRRLFGGAEGEWAWDKNRSLRLAYDYYQIRFPNYQSLESEQDENGLGREFNQPDVLNNTNHAFTLSTQLGLPGQGVADLSAGYTMRQYGQQHIVVETGLLTPDTRHDDQQLLSAQGTWPVVLRSSFRLFTSVGYSWMHLYSDQNHYDAAQLFYNANFYSYVTQAFTNHWTMVLGQDQEKAWSMNLNLSASRQSYSDRRVQDATGVYGSDNTHVDFAYLGLGAAYPIAKGFSLTGTVNFGWSDSNNHYNALYQYHYNTQSYLMGFTYAY